MVSNLQQETLHSVLQVQTPASNQMTLQTPIVDFFTGLNGTPVGGTALIPTVGVPLNVAGWKLMLDYSFPSAFQMGGGGLITAQIPAGIPTGRGNHATEFRRVTAQ